jgi:hypothetical protein
MSLKFCVYYFSHYELERREGLESPLSKKEQKNQNIFHLLRWLASSLGYTIVMIGFPQICHIKWLSLVSWWQPIHVQSSTPAAYCGDFAGKVLKLEEIALVSFCARPDFWLQVKAEVLLHWGPWLSPHKRNARLPLPLQVKLRFSAFSWIPPAMWEHKTHLTA